MSELRATFQGKPLTLEDIFVEVRAADDRAEKRHEFTRSRIATHDADIGALKDRLAKLEGRLEEFDRRIEDLRKVDAHHALALEDGLSAMRRLVTETRQEIEDAMQGAHGVNVKILRAAEQIQGGMQDVQKDVRVAVKAAITEESQAITTVAHAATKDPRTKAFMFAAGAFAAGFTAAVIQLLITRGFHP